MVRTLLPFLAGILSGLLLVPALLHAPPPFLAGVTGGALAALIALLANWLFDRRAR